MRIKFIEHESVSPELVGQEWQGDLNEVGHTIVAGHRIAANGVLKDFVEDITEYDAEGNEVIYYPIAFEEEAPA